MTTLRLVFIAIAAGTLVRCSNPGTDKGKVEIINTDKAFSALSKERGMKQAFLEYASAEVVILRRNSLPWQGWNEMERRFRTFSDTGFLLTWEPLFAHVAKSEDLGYSYGIYTSVSKIDSTIEKGTYVTVWEKGNDGRWKFVLDAGNDGLGEQQ